MVTPSLLPLLDLCFIRIAYFLWCRQAIVRTCVGNINSEVENAVKKLLPKRLAWRLLGHMALTGEYLISLLCLWFPDSDSWELLPADMLFECLILNGFGLIDQRRTAERLLSSRMFNSVFAFRLACVNYLEREVLKLWIHVKAIYLHRIMFEVGQSDALRELYHLRNETPNRYRCHDPQLFNYIRKLVSLDPLQRTKEPHEVLFWIGYCLSKENTVDISEVPHFSGYADWYLFCLESAAFTGNVTCFDYFKSIHYMNYDYVDMIDKIFRSKTKRQQSCFIFHFLLLNSDAKEDLFQESPEEALSHFLQWPLSQTFEEDPKAFWDLIPELHKDWVFKKILAILLHEHTRVTRIRNIYFVFDGGDAFKFPCHGITDGIYNIHHLESIWISLWNSCPDSYKLVTLESVVLKSIKKSVRNLKFGRGIRKLVQKLHDLFLSKGEAVLELYESANMEECLRRVFAKYMPGEFANPDTQSSSFVDGETAPEKTKQTKAKTKQTTKTGTNKKTKTGTSETPKTGTSETTKTGTSETTKTGTTNAETKETARTEVDVLMGEYKVIGCLIDFTPINPFTPIHNNFLNYIKNILFSWFRD